MSVVNPIKTLEFDVVSDPTTPQVTMNLYGDGSVEFTNKDGVVRRAHSSEEYAQEIFALIDSIPQPVTPTRCPRVPGCLTSTSLGAPG